MTRQEARAAGATRYTGRPCERCGGVERYVSSNQCVECHLGHMSERCRSEERRVYMRHRSQTSDVRKANAAAADHRRRVRFKDAISRAKATERAWRALKSDAKRLGMTVDHRIPLAGCRVCKRKGLHIESNWALLPKPVNSSKGNRCMDCYMAELGRPVVVWLPDQGGTNPPGLMEKPD